MQKDIENRISDPGFRDEISYWIKEKLSEFYDPVVVEKVLDDYKFEIKSKRSSFRDFESPYSYVIHYRNSANNLDSKRTKGGLKIGE